ncbi:MAG TPA: hypothetical protein VNO14_06570, partial [Blastocatellia bacterium]|nr:hypothetical protein [Blastocatellia bacterium]
MLAALESSLGFSIKRDLIPTLGNEVAISLHGFSDLMRSKSSARPAARKPAPRILFMLSVRDPLLFEKLFARLIAPRGRRVSRPFAQLSHRGATIRYNKDIAYTITGGFFIAGASASEIRRAIDARALNTSLASRPEFASAMGASRPVMMQAYLSPAVSGSLLDSTKGTAAGAAKGARSPLALTIMSDEDGFLMEMRVPTELALAGLASMAANRPAAYGITSSPSSGARRRAGRRSPTFTDDDLIRRKP